MESVDYRVFLREELLSRLKRNPSYSARAMARDLNLSAPFLSQVLSGNRILSEERAFEIAEKLSWTRLKKTLFIKLVRYESMQDTVLGQEILDEVESLKLKAKSKPVKSKFHKLHLNEFKVVSEWQHMALYELTAIKGFRSDSRWIANRLGISPKESEESVERLIQVGLLEWVDGRLQKTKGDCKLSATPSAAIRTFHSQHLKLAAEALETQDQHARDFSGTTMAIDIKKLPRAKALIRQFNEQMMQLLESGPQTAVFQLSVQLYRLDHPGKDQ
jgi:uncharacterized protein (TIGR02147 family)